MAETLHVVLEHAERERDAALVALRHAEQRLQQARHAQHDLGNYRAQHDARWLEQFQREGAGMPLVQTAAQFGHRLTDAIGQQEQQITLLEQRVAQARHALQERELRVASVRKLIERRAAERLQRLERADQKATDEFGAQRHRNR